MLVRLRPRNPQCSYRSNLTSRKELFGQGARSLERRLPFRRKAESRFRTGAKHSTEKKIGFRSARGHHSRRTLIRAQRQGQEYAPPHPSLRLPVVGGIEDNLGPHRSTNHNQKRRVINDCLDRRYSSSRSLRYDVDIWRCKAGQSTIQKYGLPRLRWRAGFLSEIMIGRLSHLRVP